MRDFFENNQFVIEDYDRKRTFSSFLPGIAGKKGIPVWAFYANRGQGITSFGIRDKDEPILEFFPANTSYQYVDKYGFRSFVRVGKEFFEPFGVQTADAVKRIMRISRGHFSIEEINETRKIHYKVTYFGMANEPIAGLVRKVSVTNLGDERTIEAVDGIANILASGATTEGYKSMSNLMVSWMNVENLENNLPFYKFRASSCDRPEVSMTKKGHFYLSFVDDYQLIKPIVDPEVIFGHDTSLTVPFQLQEKGIEGLDRSNQIVVNKVPCGFTPYSKKLGRNQGFEIHTIIGSTAELDVIHKKGKTYSTGEFINRKLREAEAVIDELVNSVESKTNFELFDAYLQQNFLDNALRGGYPLVYGKNKNKKIYHIYSRKHGDPERDYNFFKLSPEFYSQGNGNFRDVNQNRRNDVFFVPEAGLFNLKMFMNLIQLDGYNPLVVEGTTFTLKKEKAEEITNQFVSDHREEHKEEHKENKERIIGILSEKFTPGKISMEISSRRIELKSGEEQFTERILDASEQHIEASFGEGFWTDHWTYNMDLIESYLSIFPDQLEDLLHDDETYCYYESPASVRPRSQKYAITPEGKIRQYGAIEEEPHSRRFNQSNWVKDASGRIYQTNLAQKLLTLVLTKLSSLDPSGMGIEMEGNKPGWNDAMNGLPGLFGSGMSETLELVRLLGFLKNHLMKDVVLCEENYRLYEGIKKGLKEDLSHFRRWDSFTASREAFRAEIKQGVKGAEKVVSKQEMLGFLREAEDLLLDGIERAKTLKGGIMPTYLIHTPKEFEPLQEKTPYGLQGVRIISFDVTVLPSFLQGPARSMKIGTPEKNREQHQKVKASGIYDHQLKMYKTSEPLDDLSYEVGRIRAFTPGWLERESNFLHMTYKYLLSLLKGGLYDSFYEEIKTNLVCFMNPEVYGRSTLENSSFIASSLNPDPKLHGRGFVARLSGSTAEMLSMWRMMFFGEALFTFEEELIFSPKPLIHSSFFLEGKVKTMLFSRIRYIIENNTGESTYSEKVHIDHYLVDGRVFKEIKGKLAERIRARDVDQVVIVYKANRSYETIV